MYESAYHSPELSETDQEDPTARRKIIVKDLRWTISSLKSQDQTLNENKRSLEDICKTLNKEIAIL